MKKLVTRKLGIALLAFFASVFPSYAQANSESQSYKAAELKEAVGKRKVFVLDLENSVRTDVTKQLVKSGFSVTEDRKKSDLVLELTYGDWVTEYEFVGNNRANRRFVSKILTLTVSLVKETEEYLIYSQTFDNAKKQTMAVAYGIIAPPPKPPAQAKHLVKNFLSRMKVAGDKFK